MKKNSSSKIELIVICIVYLLICLSFVVIKRPTESVLENRNLEKFPENVSVETILSGRYFSEIDKWYSDTIPFRDNIMSLSYRLKNINGVTTKIDLNDIRLEKRVNEEVKATRSTASASVAIKELLVEAEEEKVEEVDNAPIGEDYTLTKGIAVYTDKGGLRAVEEFPGYRNGDEVYSYTINLYKERFKDKNVYSMIIPTSVAYYCPDELKKIFASEEKCIENLNSFLSDDVIKVDVYNVLKKHIDEDIYLRTDHHWSPLGAYYAAEEFAKLAKVKFNSIEDSYEKGEVEKYYGSLYRLTGNERLKDSYEKFTYYLPKNIKYTMLQYKYVLNERGVPVDKILPEGKADYFNFFSNLDTRAYQIYLGNDNNTSRLIMQDNRINRNLLILKDSFGNPIPSYLFYGFDTIHIIDFRYFLDNIEKYVNENFITDILFINSVTNCIKDRASVNYRRFLEQNYEEAKVE